MADEIATDTATADQATQGAATQVADETSTDASGTDATDTATATDVAAATGADKGVAADADADKGKDAAGTWPEDWRDQMAEGDEDATKLAKRYGSPKGILKALKEAQALIRSGKVKRDMPDPTDAAAMAEWRKEQGVPDEPAGYKVPAAVEKFVTDEDKPVLASFYEFAHAKGASQSVIDVGAEWYFNTLETMQAERVEGDNLSAEKAEDSLRKEWGPEYRSNMTLGKRFLDSIPEIGATWAEARLPTGQRLGDVPGFIQWAADQGRNSFGDAAFATADGTARHNSRKAEIEGIMKTDFNRYWAEGLDKEYQEIVAREEKRGAA